MNLPKDFLGRLFRVGQLVGYVETNCIKLGIIEKIVSNSYQSHQSHQGHSWYHIITVLRPKQKWRKIKIPNSDDYDTESYPSLTRKSIDCLTKCFIVEGLEEDSRQHEDFFILKDLQAEIKAGKTGNKELKKVFTKYETLKKLDTI